MDFLIGFILGGLFGIIVMTLLVGGKEWYLNILVQQFIIAMNLKEKILNRL